MPVSVTVHSAAAAAVWIAENAKDLAVTFFPRTSRFAPPKSNVTVLPLRLYPKAAPAVRYTWMWLATVFGRFRVSPAAVTAVQWEPVQVSPSSPMAVLHRYSWLSFST